MARKIGILKYPDDVSEIMSDRKLGKPFRAFIKTRMADENTRFLDANYDPKKMYHAFISDKANPAINIPGEMRARADALAKAGDWKNKEWKNIIRDCMEECEVLLDSNFKTDFWKSKEFLEVHEKLVRASLKGDPRKAADLLGVSDVKAVEAVMVATAAGDQKKAGVLSNKLARAEKLLMAGKEMLKALRKAGFA